MSKIMRSLQVLNEAKPDYKDSPFKMDNSEPLGYLPIDDVYALIQPNDSVLKVLFGMRCANKALRNELGSLFGHLLFNDERSISFSKTLISAVNDATFNDIHNYERILFRMFTMNDSYKKERLEGCLKLFMRVIENNSSDFAFMENLTAMLIKFAKKSKVFRNHFYSDKIVDKVNKWLQANISPPITSVRSHNGVFKNNKRNTRYSNGMLEQNKDSLKEFNMKRKAELKSMYKKLDTWEDPDLESEDDLFEQNLKSGTKIDVENSSYDFQWYSSTVSCNLGNIIKVIREDSDDMEVDGKARKVTEQWLNKDQSEIAPYQSKTRSARAGIFGIYQRAYNNY